MQWQWTQEEKDFQAIITLSQDMRSKCLTQYRIKDRIKVQSLFNMGLLHKYVNSIGGDTQIGGKKLGTKNR